MGIEDLGTLNLADADTSAGDFEPLPPAAYDVHIHDITAVEIPEDKEDGKLPPGTPGWNIQFRVDGGKYDNRVLFKRFYIPPTTYDAEKRKKSLGIFVNFLVAMGYDQSEIMSGSFTPDPSDWLGKEVKVNVKIRPAKGDYAAQNEITSIKPRGTVGAALGSDGVL
jgi:hypothetical protein